MSCDIYRKLLPSCALNIISIIIIIVVNTLRDLLLRSCCGFRFTVMCDMRCKEKNMKKKKKNRPQRTVKVVVIILCSIIIIIIITSNAPAARSLVISFVQGSERVIPPRWWQRWWWWWRCWCPLLLCPCVSGHRLSFVCCYFFLYARTICILII